MSNPTIHRTALLVLALALALALNAGAAWAADTGAGTRFGRAGYTPSVASSAAPPVEVAADEPDPEPWRAILHNRIKHHQLWWIVPAAAMDFSARGFMWIAGGYWGPISILPAVGFQLHAAFIVIATESRLQVGHKRIDKATSPLQLAREARRDGWKWFGSSMAALGVGWLSFAVYAEWWGPGFLILSIGSWICTLPLMFAAIADWVVAHDATRVAEGETWARKTRRTRGVKITSVSPLGVSGVW